VGQPTAEQGDSCCPSCTISLHVAIQFTLFNCCTNLL
jgi:hypothetical protein